MYGPSWSTRRRALTALVMLAVLLAFAAFPGLGRAGDDVGGSGGGLGAKAETQHGGPQGAGAAAVEPRGVPIAAGRTTTIQVQPALGRPVEREPQFVARVPAYLRAVAMDAEQRWSEATGLYQQALVEVGAAIRTGSDPIWEQAAFKVDLERRRSQVLAHAGRESWGRAGSDRRFGAGNLRSGASNGLTAIDRGRLLRLKLMSVRAATGTVPPALLSAALGALQTALLQSAAAEPPTDTAPRPRPGPATKPPSNPVSNPPRLMIERAGGEARGGEAEVRLLLCATRAVGGDRSGARLELAHVAERDRSDPARALAMATCQAALRHHDEALAALAVAVYRLGPSSRFLPGQTRELQSANDWDLLRLDPRFDRLFR